MKYSILVFLFLASCSTYDKDHSRKMFAGGARSYCIDLSADRPTDAAEFDRDMKRCEEIYWAWYRGLK